MLGNLMLLVCVFVLMGTTTVLADAVERLQEASAHIHCMDNKNYNTCKKKFLNDVRIQIKQGK